MFVFSRIVLRLSSWLVFVKTGVLAKTTRHSDTPTPSKTRADFLVQGLETLYPAFGQYQGDLYAGTLPTDDRLHAEKEEGGRLMFFFWDPQPQQGESFVDDSLVFWFNGGPGCSSVAGTYGSSKKETPHAFFCLVFARQIFSFVFL